MGPSEYIQKRIASAGNEEEAAIYRNLADLHHKKLWHQLTEELLTLLREKRISKQLEFYADFISTFAEKLNGVAFAKIVKTIARNESSSPSDGIAFLDPHLEPKSVIMGNAEAQILLMSECATLYLKNEDRATARKMLDKARDMMDTFETLENDTQASFYASAADYHKVVGTAADFYKNALLFLAYCEFETLSNAERLHWALDLGVAALVGEDVYTFGELLLHQVIRDLEGTENAWLMHLLEAFDRGNLTRFDQICSESAAKMNAQPALVAHADFLRQKITVLSLMNLAFERTHDRTISFADIAERCRLPISEVEYLLMRALSLKLISGVIDGVDQTVTVTRVQPRVIGRTQTGDMAVMLENWCDNVKSTLGFLEKETTELFA